VLKLLKCGGSRFLTRLPVRITSRSSGASPQVGQEIPTTRFSPQRPHSICLYESQPEYVMHRIVGHGYDIPIHQQLARRRVGASYVQTGVRTCDHRVTNAGPLRGNIPLNRHAGGLAPAADLRFCLWGGLDSNQRPTDYEAGVPHAADLQEFLRILVRAIP
jgi:hypothetical protein